MPKPSPDIPLAFQSFGLNPIDRIAKSRYSLLMGLKVTNCMFSSLPSLISRHPSPSRYAARKAATTLASRGSLLQRFDRRSDSGLVWDYKTMRGLLLAEECLLRVVMGRCIVPQCSLETKY